MVVRVNKLNKYKEVVSCMDLNKLTKKQLIELLQKMGEEESTREEVEQEVKEEPRNWTRGDLYKIKDELVEVQSVDDGVVVFISPKTKNRYKWHNKGDIEFMTIDEVLQMSNKKLFLQTPLLKVLDDRVVKALNLDYSAIDKIDNVEEFIKLDIEEIKDTLNRLSDEYIKQIKMQVINAIKNSNLSYNKVNALVELFEINRLDLQ